jgi:hypothetical protein
VQHKKKSSPVRPVQAGGSGRIAAMARWQFCALDDCDILLAVLEAHSPFQDPSKLQSPGMSGAFLPCVDFSGGRFEDAPNQVFLVGVVAVMTRLARCVVASPGASWTATRRGAYAHR